MGWLMPKKCLFVSTDNTQKAGSSVNVYIYWFYLNSLALFRTPKVKKRKPNSRNRLGQLALATACAWKVMPQSTWKRVISNHLAFVFHMLFLSAVFPSCFPQCCLGLKRRQYTWQLVVQLGFGTIRVTSPPRVTWLPSWIPSVAPGVPSPSDALESLAGTWQ